MKISVITGTRAEYGLLKNLMIKIKNDKNLILQTIATGMHLKKEFGLTYKVIEKDGFKINKKIDIGLKGDTPDDISLSLSKGFTGFSKAYLKLKPDLIIILGDRFELISAAYSATIHRIPICHIHGGEETYGLIDDPTRHALTKLSHYHFVTNKVYKKRVIQMGEHPSRVFNVGGLGVDCINNERLAKKKEIEKELKLKFLKKNILVTFHPVTLENNTSKMYFSEILKSLSKLKDTRIIFTYPNADSYGRIIIKMINDYCNKNKNASQYISLGQKNYYSLLKYVDLVLGNSSSGLLEVPTFKIPTVNIGDRQTNRLKAISVIDCKPINIEISAAITRAYSKKFQKKIIKVKNPYGTGGASGKIINILKKKKFSYELKKKFYDI